MEATIKNMDWDTFVQTVCNRFDRDEHNHLLRRFFHIKQTVSVTKYIEEFSDIVHQLLAHDPIFSTTVFTNRFVDGLKKEIRSVIMIHRPQDLDTASSLALLQEEAVLDQVPRRSELGSYKKQSLEVTKSAYTSLATNTKFTDDKKQADNTQPKTGEDKIAALKKYRRSKGLCFKCGEKWSPQHTCPANVTLQAMEELWKCVTDGEELCFAQPETESDEDLMAISFQALTGTEGLKTLRLRGHLLGREVFMLIDLGSSHSFISDTVAAVATPWHALPNPVKVQVANGDILSCRHELYNQVWGCQGYTFNTTMKIIPLRGYDIVLGMDWLGAHSPMNVHWQEHWIQFAIKDQMVKLLGINSKIVMGPPVSLHQL
jgi:hypothetical protein